MTQETEYKFFTPKPTMEDAGYHEDFVRVVVRAAQDNPEHFLSTVASGLRTEAERQIEEAQSIKDRGERNAVCANPNRKLRVARLVERAAELASRLPRAE